MARDEPATPFMTLVGAPAGSVWSSNRKDDTPAAVARTKPVKSIAKSRSVVDLPDFIEPQLTKPVAKPAVGPGWAHEIKFDGYRMQMRTCKGAATLRSRKGLDWSARFPEIVASGARLSDGILDGEVVALDNHGAPDFASLQAAISDQKTADLVFFVFDQMFSATADLRQLPLGERKMRLKTKLENGPDNIRYVDHFVTAGDAVFCNPHAGCIWRE